MAGNAPRKTEPAKAKVDEAIAFELAIAEEAKAIHEEADEPFMNRTLFMRLWPLLRKPIPEGFLLSVSAGDGKPFASTGVRSVQVQMDRCDNVLGPLWWTYRTDYESEGKLAHVTVAVLDSDGAALLTRDAWGGMNRGSTEGNLHKGSFTNAAKQAFARLGPGHEIYVGLTDHDPDVDPEAAKQQAPPPARANGEQDVGKPIGVKKATEIVDAAWMLGLQDKLQLAASHVVGDDVGDCSSKTVATKALTDLTQMQAAKVDVWLSRKADKAAFGDNGASS